MSGWVAFTGSAPFLAGTMIQGLIILNDESYEPERWHGTLIYWAILLVALAVNVLGNRILPWVETLSMALHIVLFFALLIVMLVMSPTKQTAEEVFGTLINNSGWNSDSVAWCIGLLSSSYVLAGYDAATHLSEEMPNPAVGVPIAMIVSILINGITGFAFLLAILFCSQDLNLALESPTGYPIMEIFRQATNGSVAGATAMTCILVIMATLATVPLMASGARMIWALARDRGLPYSEVLAKIPTTGFLQVPFAALVTLAALLILLGLLNIASTTALNAVLGVSIFGLYVSYLLPIVLLLYRRITGPGRAEVGSVAAGQQAGVRCERCRHYLHYLCLHFHAFPADPASDAGEHELRQVWFCRVPSYSARCTGSWMVATATMGR